MSAHNPSIIGSDVEFGPVKATHHRFAVMRPSTSASTIRSSHHSSTCSSFSEVTLSVLKALYGRTRPPTELTLEVTRSSSFPSGHGDSDDDRTGLRVCQDRQPGAPLVLRGRSVCGGDGS